MDTRRPLNLEVANLGRKTLVVAVAMRRLDSPAFGT